MKSKLGLNPWLTIFIKPRETIKAIIGYKANYGLLFLCVLYGFGTIMGLAPVVSSLERMHYVVIIACILYVSLWGYLIFSVSSWFVFFTGKWLGGKAQYKHVRAAVAWSSYPASFSCLLYILVFFMVGISGFKNINYNGSSG